MKSKAKKIALLFYMCFFFSSVIIVNTLYFRSFGDCDRAGTLSSKFEFYSSVKEIDYKKRTVRLEFEFKPNAAYADKENRLLKDLIIDINGIEITYLKGQIMNPKFLSFPFNGSFKNFPFDVHKARLVLSVSDKRGRIESNMTLDEYIYGHNFIDTTLEIFNQQIIMNVVIRRPMSIKIFSFQMALIMWIYCLVIVLISLKKFYLNKKGTFPPGFLKVIFVSILVFSRIRKTIPSIPSIGIYFDYFSYLSNILVLVLTSISGLIIFLIRPPKKTRTPYSDIYKIREYT